MKIDHSSDRIAVVGDGVADPSTAVHEGNLAHAARGDFFERKTTAYLRSLMGQSEAIEAIYGARADDRLVAVPRNGNVMHEREYSAEDGLVQKYQGRAILLLTYTCAAHCRYCQRQDRVGRGLDAQGRMTREAIEAAAEWIGQRPDIREVILSGGDPFTYPKGMMLASEHLAAIPHVQVLRAHTRFPLQHPGKFDHTTLKALGGLTKPYYLGLHVDHPDELTPEVIDDIKRLRAYGFILRSQTVFLKGINDSVEVLERLFWSLYALGVTPEYIYHCIPLAPALRFVMLLADEVEIMSQLRQRLSGNAYPHHVVNIPGTFGKILLPTNAWKCDLSVMRDFDGVVHQLTEDGRCLPVDTANAS
jgi:lysine 2,3-aminomutase